MRRGPFRRIRRRRRGQRRPRLRVRQSRTMRGFIERLASGPPIVADGGMGAVLRSAVAGLRCPEEANVRAAESVVDLHLGYIRAGAELIETNTFGANRPKLAPPFPAAALAAIRRGSALRA